LPDNWVEGSVSGRVMCYGLPEMGCAGALDYLLQYPYGCLEQTVSTAFPLLYMDVLYAGSGRKESIEQYVGQAIWRLASMQQVSGGFSYWPEWAGLYPWGSVYAAHFLVEAERLGFDVPDDMLKSALFYLDNLLRNNSGNTELESLRLYACYVLSCAGRPVGEWLSFFLDQETLRVESRSYLVGALVAQGRKKDARKLLEYDEVAPCSFELERLSGALSSRVRLWAFGLMGWLDVDPGNAAVPALVRQLLSARHNGCWATTQDNAMALLALSRYYKYVSGMPQGFRAELSWDEEQLSFDQASSNVMFSFDGCLPEHVAVSNAGPGPVYYYWSVQGVPVTNDVSAITKGIRIQRKLYNQAGYPMDGTDLHRGDVVVIEWLIDTESALNDVVIEDLLPACFEVEQAGLLISTHIPWIKKRVNLSLRHVDVRDDRVVGFTGIISGEHRWYYVVRVVSDGVFTYPAIQAEAMYEPGFHGNSEHGELRIGQ